MLDLTAIRRELPAVERCVYLNTGSAGPMPRRAAETLRSALARELDEGRGWIHLASAARERREALRASVAALLGAEPGEIALTHHTSDGMNIVLWGLDWQPGDEVLTTDAEHEGGLVPLYLLHRRRGVAVKFARLGSGSAEEALAAIRAGLGPRTRLVMVSHVSFSTGARLPLAEIAAAAHAKGARVLVDGAQSAGALPVDVKALGVDFYAVPGQKWLLGPEGTGALYVRGDALAALQPTFASYASVRPGSVAPDAVALEPAEGARRFEVGTVFAPGEAAWQAALEWLAELGWPELHARIAALAALARTRLSEIPGVRVTTPPNAAGLLHFEVHGRDPAHVVDALRARGFMVRMTPHPPRVRVSVGFFNTEEEIARLAAEVAGLAHGDAGA